MTQTSQLTATIGIDARLAGQQHAGIGRYVENLITRLPALAPDINFVYFFYNKEQSNHLAIKPSSHVKFKYTPIRHYTLAEQLKLPSIFASEELDLLHVPHFNIPIFYKGKTVTTIHDLLWHEQKGTTVTTLPQWQYWIKYLAYKYVSKQAVSKSSKIIVPAKTIKKTILKYYPDVKNKIVVTYEGIDTSLIKSEQGSSGYQSLRRSSQLLYVGSLYPHKNIDLVLQALTKLPNYTLNIVGSRNVFQDKVRAEVKQLMIENQVNFLGYVADKELTQLYQNSFALVQPSLSEGFGLTGVEAMATGTPVLASDIPIFREIYKDAATYFDPYSVDSFIQSVKKLEKADRQKVIQLGKEIASAYNWDTMVEQTVEVYRKILDL